MSELELVALFGPTGVGKTAVAVAFAERLRARGEDPVAVSADALQIYRGLETLTGVERTDRLEQRLVSIVDVTETFSAGRYAKLAHAEIDSLIAEGRRPIVVGGTGLYLRAALTELDLRPPPDPEVRAALLERAEREGLATLHAELPDDGARDASRRPTAPASPARSSSSPRATSRRPATSCGRPTPAGRPGSSPSPWSARSLYERIEARVDAMVAAGAADEVRRASHASATARKALGFAELEAGDVEAMKRATRRYARRQLTWLRKLPDVTTIDVTGRGADEVAEMMDR